MKFCAGFGMQFPGFDGAITNCACILSRNYCGEFNYWTRSCIGEAVLLCLLIYTRAVLQQLGLEITSIKQTLNFFFRLGFIKCSISANKAACTSSLVFPNCLSRKIYKLSTGKILKRILKSHSSNFILQTTHCTINR